MIEHIRILAIFHILWSLFLLLTAALMLFMLAVIFVVMAFADGFDWLSLTIIALIGLISMAVYAVLALPGLVGGAALLRGRGWSRIPLFISAIISLSMLPYGLVLFGYTVVVLLDADVQRELAGA